MDALKNTYRQFATLFAAMSPSQRATLFVVPVSIAIAFGYLALRGGGGSYTAASWGKAFTTEQLIAAEETLIRAGLTEFRREGQRIMVPASAVEEYNAALLVDGGLPEESMSELERQLEKSSIFTSRDQLRAMQDIALKKELQKVLRASPDVDDAQVHWARSKNSWPARGEKVTATVSLRPKPGRPLSAGQVAGIRAAVANMIPHLNPADVTIFDLATATAHTESADGDPFDAKVVQWIAQHAESYRRKIADALAYIPEVAVQVHVDIDDIKSQVVREQTLDKEKTVAFATRDVSRTVESQQFGPESEPGAVSNTPRQLSADAGRRESSSTNETDSASRVVPSYKITEQQFLAAMPKAVRVSVSIPDDYAAAVVTRRDGLPPGETDAEKQAFRAAVAAVRTEEEQRAAAFVRTLIPEGSPAEAVTVATVTRIEPDIPAIETPILETVSQVVSRWGGPAVMTLLAAWAVMTVGRGLGKSDTLVAAEEEASEDSPLAAFAAAAQPESEEPEAPPEPEFRDLVQDSVRDNPEAAAAILSKWIAAGR